MDFSQNIKRNHHFVFQRYLEEWIDPSKNELWVLMEKKKLFSTGTAGVAFKRSFYTIKGINEEEKKLLNCYISTMHPAVQEQMRIIINAYLLPIKNRKVLDIIKQVIVRKFGTEEEIPLEIKEGIKKLEHSICVQENNIMEDYYCEIERELANFIKRIKTEGIGFYYKLEDNEKFSFLLDICIQYYRTMTLKKRWVQNFGASLNSINIEKLGIDINKIDLNNLSFFYFWSFQNLLAYSLLKQEASVVLLCNNTSVPFITSDQPVINLKCDYCDNTSQTTELEFYYPISPTKALLINKKCSEYQLYITENEVTIYNTALVNASKQFLIGNNKKVLEQFMNK